MLIDGSCRLCAAVAIRVVEIEGGDAMFAEGAFECDAAVHRVGGVISHIFIVVFYLLRAVGQSACNLRECRMLSRPWPIARGWSELTVPRRPRTYDAAADLSGIQRETPSVTVDLPFKLNEWSPTRR